MASTQPDGIGLEPPPPQSPTGDRVVPLVWVGAAVLTGIALVLRVAAMEPGMARALATVWATIIVLWAAYAWAPGRRVSEVGWRRWRAAWSAALAAFLVHCAVSILGPLDGSLGAMFDTPLVSTPTFNLILTLWWSFDVFMAWSGPDREEPVWLARQRTALHAVMLVAFTVASVVQGSPTARLLGTGLILIALASAAFRKSGRPVGYATAVAGTAALVLLMAFPASREGLASLTACGSAALQGLRPVAQERGNRFLGKVSENALRCRGGSRAVDLAKTPWVDWSNYWGTGDSSSLFLSWSPLGRLSPGGRGVDGALLDLEYQRIELVRYNLFDNEETFDEYVEGRDGVAGPALKTWPEMRLDPAHPSYEDVGGDGAQLCTGELIRFRTTTGICNDIRNPAMGSTGMSFARNSAFEEAFPERGLTELTRNRHGDRIGILEPDPQTVSRRLFTRPQSDPDACRDGLGSQDPATSRCDYSPAPFLNVLAAFWVQFMTHDWFSHLDEGRNSGETMPVGCSSPDLGCRPGDRMDRALLDDHGAPGRFDGAAGGWRRAPATSANHVTAWWDASQIYGFDDRSTKRVKRDPRDRARLRLSTGADGSSGLGTLPLFEVGDPIADEWGGQEAVAFPDNWSVGLSFLHNVFAREHNLFVDAFREAAAATPDGDSGLRSPLRPGEAIPYRDVADEELFQIARLVVSAVIAKIHTIEWTTQLLYNEPLYRAMNANWSGLFHGDLLAGATERITRRFASSSSETATTQWFSVFASGSGIFGLGNQRVDLLDGRDLWDMSNPGHVNGGVNHFGSPFNFPEEFTTVYRLHPLIPDLLEVRDPARPDRIALRLPTVSTFRSGATLAMEEHGMPSLGLSLGRQRLGLLTLRNHPLFLQNLPMPPSRTGTGKLDVIALDLIRDRERGIPRYNEFRRQYGLRSVTSFDDFVDQRLPAGSETRLHHEELAEALREVYGQHRCDDSRVITAVQHMDGELVTDCLGHADGTVVDNVEDLDVVVGFLAESTRPHGFAISETQFIVFILNASRRLFSDRFFTSSFRPEFYSHLGVRWVNDNGPDGTVMEAGLPNGHAQEVLPFKRVLTRTVPELADELAHVVNTFDPWARDRGGYYSLSWTPRPGAESDESFRPDEENER